MNKLANSKPFGISNGAVIFAEERHGTVCISAFKCGMEMMDIVQIVRLGSVNNLLIPRPLGVGVISYIISNLEDIIEHATKT